MQTPKNKLIQNSLGISGKKEKSYFVYLDIFGLNFQFKADRSENHRTKWGAVFTIIYFCITICLFFGFGMDLYQRKRPRVSNNNKLVQYEQTPLSNGNFTFAFRVEDRTGKEVINSSIINLELTYFYYIMNAKGQWEAIFSDFHPFVRCTSLKGISKKEEAFNISLASWYCIDFDEFKMGGNWDGNFVYGMLINTKQCSDKKQEEIIDNKKNITCLKEQDLKASFQNDLTGANFFYSFLYMEALPEMDDYEQPIKMHLVNKYEMLSLKASKRSVQTYKKVIIENDRGWFFSELERFQFFSSDSILTDFSFKDEFTEDILYTHLIYFGNKVDFYNRSYMKIQEVIANIGGFAKIFYTFMSFLYMFIGGYLKNKYLMSRIDFVIKDDGLHNFNNNGKELNSSSVKENFIIRNGLKGKHISTLNATNRIFNISNADENKRGQKSKDKAELDKFSEYHRRSASKHNVKKNSANLPVNLMNVSNFNFNSSVNASLNANLILSSKNKLQVLNSPYKSGNNEDNNNFIAQDAALTANNNLILENNKDNLKIISDIALGNNSNIEQLNLNFIDSSKKNENYNWNKNVEEKKHTGNIFNTQLNTNKSSLFKISKEKSPTNSRKIDDSDNCESFYPQIKESNKLNLNTNNQQENKNESMFQKIKKNRKNFFNSKLKKSKTLESGAEVSIWRLIYINAFNLRKTSTPRQLGFYYYYFNNFKDFCDKKFNVFNYLRVCEELENLKDILFEEYSYVLSKIRPVIDLGEYGIHKNEKSYNDHDNSRIGLTRVDRILKNLFSKLEKM